MWAITSFGYVTNDLRDVEADRVNKPDRPLPSGRVSRPAACTAAAILAVLVVGLASTVDGLAVLAACFTLALLVAYNVRLKSTVLLGNGLIAALSGAALGVGGYTVGDPWALFSQGTGWPGVLVALFILAREVLKTIEDVAGDRSIGVRTVATAWGPGRAGQVFAVLVLIWAVLSLIVYWSSLA
jgi:geranylgeranylglycerol-phosphate geranylgeranyltransferase